MLSWPGGSASRINEHEHACSEIWTATSTNSMRSNNIIFFVSSHSLPSKKEKVPRSANKLPHTMQCTQQQQQHKHKHNASLSFMKNVDDVASHACGVCAHCLFAVCYATNTVWGRPVMVSSQLKNLFANKLSNNKLKSFRGIWKQKWRRKPKATKKKNNHQINCEATAATADTQRAAEQAAKVVIG